MKAEAIIQCPRPDHQKNPRRCCIFCRARQAQIVEKYGRFEEGPPAAAPKGDGT